MKVKTHSTLELRRGISYLPLCPLDFQAYLLVPSVQHQPLSRVRPETVSDVFYSFGPHVRLPIKPWSDTRASPSNEKLSPSPPRRKGVPGEVTFTSNVRCSMGVCGESETRTETLAARSRGRWKQRKATDNPIRHPRF